MPTDTTAIVAQLGTLTGQAWLWGLAISLVLFGFILGSYAIKGGMRSVLRHVRGLFRF